MGRACESHQPLIGGTRKLGPPYASCRSAPDAVETASMKLISYQTDRGPRIAGLRGDEIIDLHDTNPALPSCPKAFLAMGFKAIGMAEKALASGRPVNAQVTPLPPVPSPEKIVCIGLNYADHARETKAAIPSCPVVFNKFPTTLLPHEGTVRLPRESTQVDYEAELVLVIGRRGRHIPVSGARSQHCRLYLRQRRFRPRLAEGQAGWAMAFRQEF